MNLNKNISIWRGDSTPPTNYHFWIKSNGQQFTFNGEKWVNYVEDIPTASLESKGLMSSQDKVNLEECIQHLEDTSNPHSVTKTQVGLGNVTNDVQVKRSEMGVANGVATLDANGKVPASQLPSYVDDIIDVYATYSKSDTGVLSDVTLYLDAAHTQLVTGEAGKIYQNIADGEPQYQFRWTGTIFSQTGASSLILGEVTGTAYDGAKGKANADNIAKIKGTSLSHIKDAAPITTAADKVSINYECYEGNQYGAAGTDHTADIPAATTSKAGVMSAADKTKLDNVATGAEVNVQSDWNVTNAASDAFIKNKPTSMPASDVSAWAKAATKPTYTKTEVGLGNVDNTSDANKPVSTAQATAIADAKKELKAELLGDVDSKLVTKVDKVEGKGLSTEDFTTALKNKLINLENYDDTEVQKKIQTLETAFNDLLEADPNSAINSFNEIVAFLKNIQDTDTLEGILNGINQAITKNATDLLKHINDETVHLPAKPTGTQKTLTWIDNKPSWIDLSNLPGEGQDGQVLSLIGGETKWTDMSEAKGFENAYGVKWKVGQVDPHLTRIGNMEYHRTLPIQSQLKGCIAQRDKIMYYLDENDWRFKQEPSYVSVIDMAESKKYHVQPSKELFVGQYLRYSDEDFNETHIAQITDITKGSLNSDGTENPTLITIKWETTPEDPSAISSFELGSRLDGYDGTVRVHCPEFWIKSFTNDNEYSVWISPTKVNDTWYHQPEILIDAYSDTLMQTVPENMGFLSTLPANSLISVVNFSDYCRGGTNNAALDQYKDTEVFKTHLGKPRGSINLANGRTYARNAGSEQINYSQYKNILYWLYVIEYANFYFQDTYTPELTEEGFHQGGLGPLTRTINYWTEYNNRVKLTPCGYNNKFGNSTGVSESPLIYPLGTEPYIPPKEVNMNKWYSGTYEGDVTLSGGIWTIHAIRVINESFLYHMEGIPRTCTYEITGLTEAGVTMFFTAGNDYVDENTQIYGQISEDGQITIEWPDNIETIVYIYFTQTVASCNITIKLVDSIPGYYTPAPPQKVTSQRWRGFDDILGDTLYLDGFMINRDETAVDFYITDNPDNYSNDLSGKTLITSTEMDSSKWVKEWDLQNEAHIFPKSSIDDLDYNSRSSYKNSYLSEGNTSSSYKGLAVPLWGGVLLSANDISFNPSSQVFALPHQGYKMWVHKTVSVINKEDTGDWRVIR